MAYSPKNEKVLNGTKSTVSDKYDVVSPVSKPHIRDHTYFPQAKALVTNQIVETMRRLPHYIIPILNQTNDVRCPAVEFSLSPYVSTHPLPIHYGEQIANPDADPVLQLVREKEKMQSELLVVRTEFEHQMKNRNVKRVRKTYADNVHLRLVSECAEIMDRDPDPYFTGEYDWYSTGSSMTLVDDRLFHVHTRKNQMNQLKFSKLKLKRGKFKVTTDNTCNELTDEIATHGNIYEVRSVPTETKQLLSVRQKNQICLIDVNAKKVCSNIESEIPFVSAFCTKSNIVTSDAHRIVKSWDTATNSTIRSDEIDSDILHPYVEPWSCVRCFDSNTFMHTDRNTMRLFDHRQPFTSPSFEFNFRRHLEDCDIVSCAEIAPSRPAVVVGTTHKLFALDIRIVRANPKDEVCTFAKWTHHLRTRPTMLHIMDVPTKSSSESSGEFMFMSGQVSGEVRLCQTNKVSDEVYTSPYFPLRPHSLADAYQVSRRKGHLVLPLTLASNQLRMCATGIVSCMSDSNTPHLIIQNSMGDLFSQAFVDRTDTPDNDSEVVANALTTWDTHLRQVTVARNPFYGTDLVDFRPMPDMLATNMTETVECADDEDIQHMEVDRNPRWKHSGSQMHSYVDALANGMVTVWEVPNDTPKPSDTLALRSKPAPVTDRVSIWLEQSAAKLDTTAEPDDVLNASASVVQPDESIHEEMDTTPAPIPVKEPKKKKARQSRVFVPGF